MFKEIFGFGLFITVIITSFPSSSLARAEDVMVGANVVHPERLDPAQRRQTLVALKQNGVRYIRVGLIDDASISFVCDAFSQGIRTDLIVHPELSPGGQGRLSAASSEALRTAFAPRLAKLDQAGVVLMALEFGNEINHPGFNDDFAAKGRGVIFGLKDLLSDPEGKQVALGFDAYIESLKVLKSMRDQSKVNGTTPLVSAGLSNVGLPGPHVGSDRDCVSIAATLEYLRQKGLDGLVDGYGIHIYPSQASTVSQVEAYFNKDPFSEGKSGGKPCWVTEWGMAGQSINRPENESERARAVGVVTGAFRQMAAEGRLAALLYYSWTPDPWSHTEDFAIYRNDRLTETGKIAVTPLRSTSPSDSPKLSEIGINRIGLSMQSEAVRQQTLENICALHATWIRDGPSSGDSSGIANFVDEVRRAKQLNLKVLVNIGQKDEDYDNISALPRNRDGWREKKLSAINLDKYAQRLRHLFSALKSAGLTVDAVEFGSEDDSYFYDADVPNGPATTPEELKTWLRGYGEFLKTGAEALHDPLLYPNAKIITFGIAHAGNDPHDPHIVNPALAVAMLRDVDGYNYLDNASYHVDGYGTHIYPGPSDVSGAATALLRQDISALGRNKPFWITEWGFLDPTQYPKKKGETLSEAVAEILSAFDDLSRRVPIGPMIFYSYNSGLLDAHGNLSGLVDANGNVVPAANALSARAGK